MISKVAALYFSPTGTTRKIVGAVSKVLHEESIENIDITEFCTRENTDRVINCDILVIGFPVYEEHVPEQVVRYLEKIRINAKGSVAISVYGNIGFGMSLKEIYSILHNKGIAVTALGAFIGEHSFSDKTVQLAFGRPDGNDLLCANELAKIAVDRFTKGEGVAADKITGSLPLMARILPKDSAKVFTKKPVINDKCRKCGICIKACPMNAIHSDYSIDDPKCLRCFACVKSCRFEARRIEYRKGVLVKHMLKRSNKKMKKNIVI